MGNIQMMLEIPEDTYLTLSSSGYTKQRLLADAKKFLAAYLFRQKVLSLGKAAELAGLRIGAFISFLDELEIPVIDYDEEELDAEFREVG